MVELEIKKKYEKIRLDVAFKSEKKRIGILGASGWKDRKKGGS